MSKTDPPREINSYKNNHLHIFIFCTGFGAVFGVASQIIRFIIRKNDLFSFLTSFMIVISSTFLSALAGLISILLDKLFSKIGINSEAKRGISIYLIIVTLVFTLGFLLIPKNNPLIQNQFFWGGLTGCGLGGLTGIIYGQYWTYKIKLQTLELENKYLAELAAKDRQIKEQTEKIAVAEERNRIARDLHDSVSQGIHSLVFLIHTLRKNCPEPEPKAAEIMNQLEKTVNATLEELRAMILELKPSLLETHGLVEAVKLQATSISNRLNIPVNLSITDFPPLTSEQETALYRILQEALTNILKHAQATVITINLTESGQNQIELSIEDNGIGFDHNGLKQGNGLQNIAARCQENHGQFQITSEPGKGTSLRITFYLQA